MTTPAVPAGLVDWSERAYLGQYAGGDASFVVYIGGQPADPDGEAMSAAWSAQNSDGSITQVSTPPVTRVAVGDFQASFATSDTQLPGSYQLAWAFSVGGRGQSAVSLFEVGSYSQDWAALPVPFQGLVEVIWARFSDLFDSAMGGPNLQSYYQAHWSRGRVAQLLGVALRKLNTISQPYMTYSFDGSTGSVFPLTQWGGVLETQGYVECVRHLIRSYTEQAAFQGGEVARLDRRDYMDRWQAVLNNELADLKDQLDVFKIRHMGFGNPKVLVSGGVYGRYAPTRIAGSVAARPRMWARWY
jgi:hypothetical protein